MRKAEDKKARCETQDGRDEKVKVDVRVRVNVEVGVRLT